MWFILLNFKSHNADLLAVVSDGLQDGPQSFETDSDIKQVGGKEEIVEVTQNGENEVPQTVQESLKFAREMLIFD